MSQDRVNSSTEQGENMLVQHRAANRQRPHRSILMIFRGFALVQRIWGLEIRSSRGIRSEVRRVLMLRGLLEYESGSRARDSMNIACLLNKSSIVA